VAQELTLGDFVHPASDDQQVPAVDGGRRATQTPLYVAVLALVTALIAAGVSVAALARSGDRSAAAAPAPAATTVAPTGVSATEPAGGETPEPTDEPPIGPTTDPSPESTSEPTGGPDPRGVYTVAYERETLRLQPSSSRSVDLDQPTANAATGTSEFYYSGYAPATKMVFDDVSIAEIRSPQPTANDCVQELRRAPIDLSVAPAKGQLLCVLTSAGSAAEQGIRQKVVLLRVDSLTADGTLNLTASAWTVPR
jgi:hypothetical protein